MSWVLVIPETTLFYPRSLYGAAKVKVSKDSVASWIKNHVAIDWEAAQARAMQILITLAANKG